DTDAQLEHAEHETQRVGGGARSGGRRIIHKIRGWRLGAHSLLFYRAEVAALSGSLALCCMSEGGRPETMRCSPIADHLEPKYTSSHFYHHPQPLVPADFNPTPTPIPNTSN